MSRRRRGGRTIDRWRIKNSAGVTIEVPIRMSPDGEGGYQFSAEYDGGPVFDITERDVNELKRKIKDVCDANAEEWVKKLHVNVTFSKEHYSDVQAASLRIAYDAIETNHDATGKPIRRSQGSTHIMKYAPDEGKHGDDDMYALIDDTPLNRERLDGIIVALLALGARVSTLMSPEKILTTISNSDRLLPAPEKNKK